MTPPEKRIHGRGARIRPPNRFESVRLESDEAPAGADACEFESLPQYDRASGQLLGKARRGIATQFVPDETQSILAENNSPDVGFRFSVNPYRGCEHGCAYCYARPTHEYLGFSAGLDFETRIVVKEDAPALLRKLFLSPKWEPQGIDLGSATDPYQPVERRL